MKRWSLRKKMLTMFLLLIAVPLSLQGLITYYEFATTIERRTADSTTQIAGQINRNLDRTLMEMQRLSLMPVYDQRVLMILNKYSLPENARTWPSLDEREKMFLYISGLAYNRPEVKGIQLIANNGFIFTNVDSSRMQFSVDVRSEDWYRRISEAQGAWVVIPQHKPNYYTENEPQTYFSVARLIREPDTDRILGIIKIDLKLDVFRNILSNVRAEEKCSLSIVNASNELFYNESGCRLDAATMKSLHEVELPNESFARDMDIGGRRFLTVVDYSDFSGLKVISFIPVSSLLKDTVALRNFTLFIAGVFLVIAGILAVFFAYRISEPLVRLKKKMMLVERGDFQQNVPVGSQDEIGQLGKGFNRMTGEINRLVKEVYEIGLKEKEAELAALQSQINPHFIYNTLESINMMAIGKSNYDVSDMVTALGKMLRYTVDKYDRLVPLSEELDWVASYVKIQQQRYGERLHVVFDVEEDVRQLPVPKLLLQPLVENAIVHGIGDKEQGNVWISAVRFGEQLLLTVRDDGAGMTEEQIGHLRASLSQPLPDGGHKRGLALRNIAQRLVMMFGADYGLEVDGSPGEGAAFTITLPVMERIEGYGDQNIAG
ncbi:histidine kinase [Gordoniibacillus kamchatkensis]|uniref:histidine kinase n=1 Tax=Gordoniibacillus kamchatkensis TaxID=1590651 RepID=A0ABR5AEW0_9BACL|nr:sensor histidine kinase [Paenibacillus sp. VKM B-2647]KIL38937.1 histidine kinase [Paenibacillus sp. VKM B-2647]